MSTTTSFTAIVAAIGLGLSLTGTAATAQEVPEEVAGAVVSKLVEGHLAEIADQFTSEVVKGLPKVEQVWTGLKEKAGPVRSTGAPLAARQGAIAVVAVPLRFERGAFDARVSIVSGKVAGLFFVPGWTTPSYADASAFSEVEVEIGQAPWVLPGTLSLPRKRGRVPAVVLVHGSGPGDRNETIGIGPNRPFLDLAGGLASRGIAVLRYDKRTKVYPAQFAPSRPFTVREETVDDAIAAARLLQTRAEIDPDRAVIVGHSLGGMLAPRIAREEPGVAALVMMAAAARPLYDLMIEQLEYIASLDGPPSTAWLDEIARVKAEVARARTASTDAMGPPILGLPPAYWADLNTFDPAETARNLRLPMLVIHGGRDYQTTAKDLDRFKAALPGRGNVAIEEFADLNHLFMPGEGKSRPEEYDRLGHVDVRVIEAIANFVDRLAPR